MNMASSGYYYQNSPYSYNYSQARTSPPASAHLCLFLLTLLLLATVSLYARCESALESLADQLRPLLVLSPLLLLLVAQYWITSGERRGAHAFFVPLPGDQSFHRPGGSSPWGVALVLVLVLFLISYQSSFQDWWFPLLSGR